MTPRIVSNRGKPPSPPKRLRYCQIRAKMATLRGSAAQNSKKFFWANIYRVDGKMENTSTAVHPGQPPNSLPPLHVSTHCPSPRVTATHSVRCPCVRLHSEGALIGSRHRRGGQLRQPHRAPLAQPLARLRADALKPARSAGATSRLARAWRVRQTPCVCSALRRITVQQSKEQEV